MTRARELGKLANKNSLTADNTNNFVGIGSTQPDSKLDVLGGAQISGVTTFSSRVDVGTAVTIGAASGIVSATAFYGDGSNLEGVASAGLGTALAETQPGNVIYYTDNILGIGSTMVVTVPTGSDVAYTQYAEVSLNENVDLIVAEGDDFVTDILGLSTSGISTLTGIGGRIRAGTFTNKAGTGAPQLTFGAEIPVGYGLTGAGGINVSGAATIGGNLNVGGVLTYEDVTNIDSVGIVTARSGIVVSSGVIKIPDGSTSAPSIAASSDTNSGLYFAGADTVGLVAGGSRKLLANSSGITINNGDLSIDDKIIHSGDTNTAIRFPDADTFTVETAGSERVRVTSTGGVHFSNAELIERVSIVANKLSAVPNVNLDNGMVHYYTTNETTTATPNIISTAGINTNMATGDTMSVTIMSKPNNAGYFPKVSIDGVATGITTYWSGGSAPSSAESSGVDVNVYQIIKTADATYDVLANTSNFA